MSSVLVIGAEGFIGKHLCLALRKTHSVTGIDRNQGDITDSATFKNLKIFDHVIHLAGRTFVPESWTDANSFLRTNVIGTNNVLEYCNQNSTPLTYISAYIYGKPERLPISESDIPRPNNPYALSKYLAEQLCEFYSNYHKLAITVLRPFNIYGPDQPKHFLIPKIIDHIEQNIPIEVMDLVPKRDYLFITDLVDAIIKTVDLKEKKYHVLNVGSGSSVSVKDLINIIQEVAGTDLPVICEDKPRFEELDDVYADVTAIKYLLDWSPATSLRAGIMAIIKSQL